MGIIRKQQLDKHTANKIGRTVEQPEPNISPLISVAELAEAADVSPATVRRLIRIGLLQATKVGRTFVISDQQVIECMALQYEIDKLITKHCRPPNGMRLECRIVCTRRKVDKAS
ncbi:MAG: helix-turn-helix domain-containing protein [Terriglobales bacterium]